MPRPDLSAAMRSATGATVFMPAIFVQATFQSGILYLWSGRGDIVWNSKTWQGVGSLLKISTVEEKSSVAATGIVVTLSGIDPTLLPNVLNEFQVTGPVKVFLGAFSSPGVLISSPITLWSGKLDQPTIDVGSDLASISIACESRLLQMNVSVERRYTDQDQQQDVPGDLAMSFVNSIQDMPVYWGQTPSDAI